MTSVFIASVSLLTALMQDLCVWFTLPTDAPRTEKEAFLGGGGVYSLSVREVKQEQSSRRKAHCHHWPAESKAFLRLGYSVSSYASALG